MYDDYGYGYGNGNGIAILIIGTIVWLLVVAAIYVLSALFLRKIFVKAGVANPNTAWIPIYNVLLFAKLGDFSPVAYLIGLAGVLLLSWIPVLGWIIGLIPAVIFIAIAYRVNLKLQKDPVAFTVFAALLSIVWLGVVAFGSGVWNTASKPVAGVAPVPPPPWATVPFFMDTTTWGGVPAQGYSVAPPAAPPTPPPAAPPTPPPAA